jgi:hypothetical protein
MLGSALAYNDKELFTTVMSFIADTPGWAFTNVVTFIIPSALKEIRGQCYEITAVNYRSNFNPTFSRYWLHKYYNNLLPFHSNYQGNVAL